MSKSSEAEGSVFLLSAECEPKRGSVSASRDVFQATSSGREVEFGKCSVFDIYVESHEDIPFEVPVYDYLEELLIGINGAPSPSGSSMKASEKGTSGRRFALGRWSRDSLHGPAFARFNRLKRVMSAQSLCDACQKLFWIAVGVITNRVVPAAISELRNQLAQAWCLVVLEVNQVVHKDLDSHDFVMGALPAILVQAIYRLLIDCFPEDKPQYIHHVDQVLEKLSHVVAYEVCGFQRNVQTSFKERKQLFRKDVLDHPYVNQRDTVKAQMRKELMEHQGGTMPLTFGTHADEGGEPLEEQQLEHVLSNREELKRKDQQTMSTGQSQKSPIPQELSVDRYARVAVEGSDLFNRQMAELLPRPSSRLTQANSWRPRSSGEASLRGSSRDESRKSKVPGCLKKNVSENHVLNAKKGKDFELSEKRRREDQLVQRIVGAPLPPELRERALDTTWVSPITDRLAPAEGDRQALHKAKSESRQLKMSPPSKRALPSLMPEKQAVSKSRSAPHLREAHELPKLENQGKMSHAMQHGYCVEMRDVHGRRHSCVGAALGATCGEELTLQPPSSMESKVIMHRLKAAGEKVHDNSFGNYAKDVDIATGTCKQRMDPATIMNAETAYVTSMQELVGPPEEPGLKMYNSPLRMAKRKMAGKKPTIIGGAGGLPPVSGG